jgi:hypothetical protein
MKAMPAPPVKTKESQQKTPTFGRHQRGVYSPDVTEGLEHVTHLRLARGLRETRKTNVRLGTHVPGSISVPVGCLARTPYERAGLASARLGNRKTGWRKRTLNSLKSAAPLHGSSDSGKARTDVSTLLENAVDSLAKILIR